MSTSHDSAPDDDYTAPTIERLGTLAELTQGGATSGMDDGFGGTGDGDRTS